MEIIQKPSKGRIVMFHNPHSNSIDAAMIVAVHSDTSVNLVSWNEGGTATTFTSVSLGEGSGRWNWPTKV